MQVLRAGLAMLIMAALVTGAALIGAKPGLDGYWSWWFATAVFVAAIILIDPANRRSK